MQHVFWMIPLLEVGCLFSKFSLRYKHLIPLSLFMQSKSVNNTPLPINKRTQQVKLVYDNMSNFYGIASASIVWLLYSTHQSCTQRLHILWLNIIYWSWDYDSRLETLPGGGVLFRLFRNSELTDAANMLQCVTNSKIQFGNWWNCQFYRLSCHPVILQNVRNNISKKVAGYIIKIYPERILLDMQSM